MWFKLQYPAEIQSWSSPMLSVCQSGLKVSFTLKNMQTDGVKWENRGLLQVMQQGRGWWASLGCTQHPPPWRGRTFLSQEPEQIIPSKSCDMLIALSGWWLELKQCSALMQAFIREQTKQGGSSSKLQARGWRRGGTHLRASTGRQKVDALF